MSGGHFDYAQYRMEDIAIEIDKLISENFSIGIDEYGCDGSCQYSWEIINRFKEAAYTIRQAQEMVQRVDWLVSGDDREETFLSRWDNEVREYFLSGGKK